MLEVFVDDNNRVKKGDLLVRIDPEPFQVEVALKRAAVDVAAGDLTAAESQARGLEALARSQRWKIQTASEMVNNQIALLKSRVAVLRTKEATLQRARSDFERVQGLVGTGALSRDEYELRQQDIRIAEASVSQAQEEIYQVRASLGLTPQPEGGKPLTDVPPDLDQTYSKFAPHLPSCCKPRLSLGGRWVPWMRLPSRFSAEFLRLDKGGNIDRIFSEMIPKVPAVIQAKARLRRPSTTWSRPS